jgi:sugar phosphate isomerase/epimerase
MAEFVISTALFEPWTLADMLPKLVEAGFAQVELSGNTEAEAAWLADMEQAVRLFNDHGVRVRSVHIPDAGWHNAASDEALRVASVKVGQTTIAHAAQLGADYVIVHANGASEPFTVEDHAASMARSRRSLGELAETAARLGVVLALENLPAYGAPRPTSRMSEVLNLIEGFGTQYGICLDTGHSHVNGVDPSADAREAGERLLCIHIQDNDGSGDQHLLPGRGTIPWETFRATLAEMGFRGQRTLEVLRGGDPLDLLEGSRQIRDAWSAD